MRDSAPKGPIRQRLTPKLIRRGGLDDYARWQLTQAMLEIFPGDNEFITKNTHARWTERVNAILAEQRRSHYPIWLSAMQTLTSLAALVVSVVALVIAL